jgi:hypothetical protein
MESDAQKERNTCRAPLLSANSRGTTTPEKTSQSQSWTIHRWFTDFPIQTARTSPHTSHF